MLASASGLKILAATPGLSGTPRMATLASFLSQAMPLTTTCSMLGSSGQTSVPGSWVKDDFTQRGTLYFMANSTERICSTLAPAPASSSISS